LQGLKQVNNRENETMKPSMHWLAFSFVLALPALAADPAETITKADSSSHPHPVESIAVGEAPAADPEVLDACSQSALTESGRMELVRLGANEEAMQILERVDALKAELTTRRTALPRPDHSIAAPGEE
jgi:hypothetical protein